MKPGSDRSPSGQAEIEDTGTRPVVVRTGGLGRRIPIVVTVVALGLAVAVIKPWGADQTVSLPAAAETSPAIGAAAPAAPTVKATPEPSEAPSPTAVPLDPLAMPCMSPADWRATTVERTDGEETRRWLVVQPTAAYGPTDASIPSVQVVAGAVRGIGFCAPAWARVEGPPTIWLLDGSTATQVAQPASLRALLPSGEGAAAMYRPVSNQASWPAGRYVIRVPLFAEHLPSGSSSSAVYFAIELLDPPHR